MNRSFYKGGRKILGHTRKPLHMSSAEIENLAISHIEEWEHTPLEKLFSRAWRLISIDSLIIGYSPFPDCSLILSLYSANIVLKQLFEYFSAEVERCGPLPAHLFFPIKGKPGIDYWSLYKQEDIRALCWHVIMSIPVMSESFGNYVREIPEPLTYGDFRQFIEAWDVKVMISENPCLLWPTQYWLNIDDETTIIKYIPWDLSCIYGEDRARETSLKRFKCPWTRKINITLRHSNNEIIPIPWNVFDE
jgi:hypothetical protein